MKNGNLAFHSVLLFLSIGLPAMAEKTITVGVALRFTDAYNHTVTSMMRGIETAKALFEKEHKGTKIRLETFPHDSELASVSTAADKIITAKIPAVIGGEMSEEAIVLGDRLGPEKIVFVTPTSSSPRVTENKPFVFRTCFSDRQVADEFAVYVKDSLKPKAVGVIHNVSSPYTDYLSSRFVTTFKEVTAHQSPNSRVPIFDQKVLRRTLDFSKQIDFFMANKVTHVVMFTHDYDVIRFVVQAESKGYFPVYVGSDGWGANQYVYQKFVKESANGSKFIAYRNSYWKEDDKRPVTKAFRQAFQMQFHVKPDAWSAISFDAARVLFAAMNQAKNPNNGQEIQQELKKIDGMPLVTTSRFVFSDDNSPRKDLFIYKISENGIQHEATLR